MRKTAVALGTAVTAGLLVVGLGAGLQGPVMAAPAQDSDAAALRDVAVMVVDELIAGRFADVHARGSSTVQAGLSAAQIEEIWTGLVAQVGAIGRTENVAHTTVGQHEVFQVSLDAGSARLAVRVALLADGTMDGLFIVPDAQ